MPFKPLKRSFSTGPLLVSTAPTLCCYRDLMIVAGGREVRTACQQNRALVPTALGPPLSRGIMCCYRDLVSTIFLSVSTALGVGFDRGHVLLPRQRKKPGCALTLAQAREQGEKAHPQSPPAATGSDKASKGNQQTTRVLATVKECRATSEAGLWME